MICLTRFLQQTLEWDLARDLLLIIFHNNGQNSGNLKISIFKTKKRILFFSSFIDYNSWHNALLEGASVNFVGFATTVQNDRTDNSYSPCSERMGTMRAVA